MALTPPISAHQLVWNHTLYWVGLDHPELTDEIVQPIFQKFLAKKVAPLSLPYVFDDVPGLVLREATDADLPVVIELTVAGGNHNLEYATKTVNQCIEDPLCWTLVWEYNGQPIQFEAITLGPDTTAYLGFLVHHKREFPQWFWGACESPVFTGLVERGYIKIRSLMRKTRAHRLPRVKKVYNIRQVGETEKFMRLEWDLVGDTLPTWPKRKTAGPDWKLVHGPVLFREMRESDLESVKRSIREEFANAGLNNGDEAATLLEERWYLERAAVLLGYVRGNLTFVRAAREREPGQAAVSTLNPMVIRDEAKIATYVALQWLQEMGYSSAVSFVPAAQYRNPKFKNYMNTISPYTHEIAQLPHHDGTVYEIGIDDFSPVLGVTLDQWLQS